MAVLVHMLTPHQHLNFCIVHCSQDFLGRECHFQHQLISSSLCTRVPTGLASSRPAPACTASPSCITSYACRLRAFVSARRTHQEHSGRRLRGSLKQLRVMGLLNLEHRESSHYYITCSIGGTVRVCQLNTGRVRTRQVRRLHKLYVLSAAQFVPARRTRVE